MASPASYRISLSPRMVTCRLCPHKLVRGDIRIDTVRGSSVRSISHAQCFMARGDGSSIQIPGDLEGWDDLSANNQWKVLGYIPSTSRQSSQPRSQQVSVIVTQSPQSSQSSQPASVSSHQSLQSSQTLSDISQHSSQPVLSSSQSLSVSSQQSSLPSSQFTSVSSQTTISSQNFYDLTDVPTSDDEVWDVDHLSDDEDDELPSQDPKRPRLDTDSQGNPIMPNLLAGVKIPEGPGRSGDECSVCLDPPLHPVTLPCGHVFCFLCAKGLMRQGLVKGSCSMCRQDIPDDYLDSSQVLTEALEDVKGENEGSNNQEWSWFYEGRNGWWRFEERNNEDLEEAFLSGNQEFETIICGHLYVINFVRMEQYQKNYPTRKRKIKRDLKTSDSKGIAGLQSRGGGLKNPA